MNSLKRQSFSRRVIGLCHNLKILYGRKNSLWCWRSPQDKDEAVYLMAAVSWGSIRKTANFLRNCGGDQSTNVKQILFTESLSLLMCYNRILSTGRCVSHRSLFRTILEAWKSKRCQQIRCLVEPASWFTTVFLLCPHIAEGVRELSRGLFYKGLMINQQLLQHSPS